MQPWKICPFLHDYLEDRFQLSQALLLALLAIERNWRGGGGGGGDTFCAPGRKMQEIIVKNHPDLPTEIYGVYRLDLINL